MASYLDHLGQGVTSAYLEPAIAASVTLVAAWVAATCCHLLLAELISARGLANGFVVLIVSFAFYDLH